MTDRSPPSVWRAQKLVPRFPTLQEQRFMAYQAIIHGARGLAFFVALSRSRSRWIFHEQTDLVLARRERPALGPSRSLNTVHRRLGDDAYVLPLRPGESRWRAFLQRLRRATRSPCGDAARGAQGRHGPVRRPRRLHLARRADGSRGSRGAAGRITRGCARSSSASAARSRSSSATR